MPVSRLVNPAKMLGLGDEALTQPFAGNVSIVRVVYPSAWFRYFDLLIYPGAT